MLRVLCGCMCVCVTHMCTCSCILYILCACRCQITCIYHHLFIRALVNSMNFADKPIDEALRCLQEAFQITVSIHNLFHVCQLDCMASDYVKKSYGFLFLHVGRSTAD